MIDEIKVRRVNNGFIVNILEYHKPDQTEFVFGFNANCLENRNTEIAVAIDIFNILREFLHIEYDKDAESNLVIKVEQKAK